MTEVAENPLTETANQFYDTEAEPTKPTEEAIVTQENQEPEQDVEKLDTPAEDETKAEELEATDEATESQFIELDGEEIDLEDVRKWKDGHLMQSDYTKKTTSLAEERKTFDTESKSERENLANERAELSDMRDNLAVLVAEDEEVNWVELKEDDPEEYIRLKEKADKRKEVLEKVKAERATPTDDPALIATEKKKLFDANPDWFDKEGKPTKTYTEETTLLSDYVAKAGFSDEEFSRMTRAHYLNTILKAAKYDAIQEKGRDIKAKREKVPVVTKPKATQTTQSKSMADTFYAKTV